jgi:hypothetical protein
VDACRELLALRSLDVSSKCSVYASAAELYNEEVRDLLVPSGMRL